MEPQSATTVVTPLPADDNWLFSRLPENVLDSLNPDQRTAIHRAVVSNPVAKPPVNIRFSLPMLRWRFYLSVVGGEERRNAERRARDRARHPLRTAGNVFFVIGIAMAFYVAAFVALALQSAIIEF